MIPVHQQEPGSGDYGAALRACLASILDKPLSDMLHPL
jgi:hypothetical protein